MFLPKVYFELQVVYHMYLFFTTHPIQKQLIVCVLGGGGGELPWSMLMLNIDIFTCMKNITEPRHYRI